MSNTVTTMAGYGENITPEYDYGDDSAPCDFTELWAFGKVFLPTIYSLVFILGFLGNGLVVCVLVKHRNQTNLTDICLFNLALADLLFVLTLPFYIHYSNVGHWTFGDFMCRLTSGSHNTGFFCSIFFMVVMTIERYVIILQAHKVARYRTLRAGIALSVAVWLVSLTVSLPVFIFTRANNSQVLSCYYNPQSDTWRYYNIFMANILGLLIPMLVMIVCYARIIPILMNMRSKKKHCVVKLIITIMVTFFIFWAPYNISLFLTFMKSKLPGDVCKLEKNLRLAVTVTETFAYTHCCLNPIIYAFVGQRFMKRVVQFLRKCVPWISLSSTRDLSDSSFKKSSAMSRSSDVTTILTK